MRRLAGSHLVRAILCALALLLTLTSSWAQINADIDISTVKQKAAAGDVAAQADLGTRYFSGTYGVGQDFVLLSPA
jgi:TPR repeat protein